MDVVNSKIVTFTNRWNTNKILKSSCLLKNIQKYDKK